MFPSFIALATFHLSCSLFTLYDAGVAGRTGIGHVLRTCAWPQVKWHVLANALSWMVLRDAPRSPMPVSGPTVAQFVLEVVACYLVGDFLIYWLVVRLYCIICIYINPKVNRGTSGSTTGCTRSLG